MNVEKAGHPAKSRWEGEMYVLQHHLRVAGQYGGREVLGVFESWEDATEAGWHHARNRGRAPDVWRTAEEVVESEPDPELGEHMWIMQADHLYTPVRSGQEVRWSKYTVDPISAIFTTNPEETVPKTEIYKNGEDISVVTNAMEESTFIRSFAPALREAVEANEIPNQALEQVLASAFEIEAKLRGYKSEVQEQRLLAAGRWPHPGQSAIAAHDDGEEPEEDEE